MEAGATVLVDGTKRALVIGRWGASYIKVQYGNRKRATIHISRVKRV